MQEERLGAIFAEILHIAMKLPLLLLEQINVINAISVFVKSMEKGMTTMMIGACVPSIIMNVFIKSVFCGDFSRHIQRTSRVEAEGHPLAKLVSLKEILVVLERIYLIKLLHPKRSI